MILRVDIVDTDVFLEYGLQGTFYLKDPDEKRLHELKDLIEDRFETGELEQFSEVIDFIHNNFETVDIETFIIEW